jgi:hypothetical protein
MTPWICSYKTLLQVKQSFAQFLSVFPESFVFHPDLLLIHDWSGGSLVPGNPAAMVHPQYLVQTPRC